MKTSGQIGRTQNYENPIDQQNSGLVQPEEDDPLPRPVFRAQITLKAPQDWGLFLGGYNLSLLYSWRAGWYSTYLGAYNEEDWGDLLRNNIRWQDERNVDIGINKTFVIAGAPINLFFDVRNVFDWGTLSSQAFTDGIDQNIDICADDGRKVGALGFENRIGGADKQKAGHQRGYRHKTQKGPFAF